jgi:hypothetical protein
MNALTIPGGAAVTMTSLELVDFINSQRAEGESELRHDHFMAKVPKVLGDAAPKFSGTAFYINGTGAKVDRTIYTFPKREACLMAMSYSYDLQAKVFDRMTALEARPIDPMQVLSDPAAMRGLLLTYTEKVLTLEHKVEELTPKAQALDRIADADGTMNPTVAAKTLQIQPKRLFDWMRKQHWIQDVSLCKRAMAPPKSQVRPWYAMARSSRLPIRSSRRATLGKTLMAASGLAGGPIRLIRRSSRSGLGIGSCRRKLRFLAQQTHSEPPAAHAGTAPCQPSPAQRYCVHTRAGQRVQNQSSTTRATLSAPFSTKRLPNTSRPGTRSPVQASSTGRAITTPPSPMSARPFANTSNAASLPTALPGRGVTIVDMTIS